MDASDRQDTRHALASEPSRSTEWQLGTLNGLVGVVVAGANARTYDQRIDRWMFWTKIRRDDPFEGSSAVLQFELQRHLQIHPLRDFVFVVAAGAVVVGTKLQTAPRALALGLRACSSPSSLGRVAFPLFGRHLN